MQSSNQASTHLRVLKAIRRAGPISRSELPDLTGLSGGTITQLTADLVSQGFVLEVKEAERRLGRPRTHLEINAGGAIVLGVSLRGVGTLDTRFVDLLGRQLFAYDAKIRPVRTLEQLIAAIGDSIAEAIEHSPFQLADLTRTGLALPGLVDSERGILHFMTTFPPGPVPAAAIVEERIGLPVTIENDQACMARALHWFGAATDLDTFTLIHIGYAIGTAEYFAGLPNAGTNGLNPEIGHMKTEFGETARACFCGGCGCVTAYCSIFGILAETELLDGLEFPALKLMDPLFDSFLDRAQSGEPRATELLDQAADHLGRAVANYLTTSDPGTVLISAPNLRLMGCLEPRFWTVLREHAMPGVLPATDVRFIRTDPTWRSSGTAALALEQVYLRRAKAPEAPVKQTRHR